MSKIRDHNFRFQPFVNETLRVSVIDRERNERSKAILLLSKLFLYDFSQIVFINVVLPEILSKE